MKFTATVTALALLAASPVQATAQAAAAPALDLPLAIDLARGAIDACSARGLNASASVVDATGNPLVILRAPAAKNPPVAAPRKAWTAALFDSPGSEMEPREKTDAAFAAKIAAEPDRLNAHAGSVPLHIGGKVVGGLAIADVAHAAADACARASLAAQSGKVK